MSQTNFYIFTIDHNKVPNTDQTNFPVGLLISGLVGLKDIAHGGACVNGNSGNDIRPYSDAGLTQALTYEKVVYNAVNGTLEMYVKIPTLSHTVDTLIYLGFGDASLNTDASSNQTWNVNYKAVYHFGDGTTLSLNDSTSNANNLTNNAVVTAVADGNGVGGAAAFVAASSQYLSSAVAPVTALPATVTALFYATDFAANRNGITMDPTASNSIGIQLDSRTTQVIRASEGTTGQATTVGTFNATTWVHAGGRYASTTDRTAYLNGVGTQDVTSSALNVPNQLAIGAFKTNGAPAGFWNGRIDEVRIASVDLGADWVATESNNLLSPNTFYSTSALQSFGAAAVVITSTPPASVNSGATFAPVFSATTNGSTVDTSFNGLATLTIASGFGGTLFNGSVNAINGVATFNGLSLTGDGKYTITCAMAGYVSVTTSSFVVIGTATSGNKSVVNSAGGSANWPAVYDSRLNVTVAAGVVSAWDDALGTLSGRTPGPQLAQATAGKRPTFTGVQGSGSEVINFVSGSSTILASGQDARFLLSGTGNQYCFVIAKVTVAGPIAGMANDPTNAALYPFIVVNPNGTTWKGRFGATGAGDETQPDSGLAFNDGVVRVVAQGKCANSGIVGGDGNTSYAFLLAGRQQQLMRSVTTATVVGGGLKLMVGGLGASYVSATVYWVGYYTGTDVKSAMAAVEALASSFGYQADLSKVRTFISIGDSIPAGTFASDGMTGLAGSGTKTPAYVASRQNSGPGTFIAQNMDVGDAHMFNYCVAGRRLQGLVDTLTNEVSLLFDGLRSGNKVVFAGIGTNDFAVIHSSTATALGVLQTLCTNVRALGAKFIVWTVPDSVLWYTTGALNSDGNNVVAYNTAVRATNPGGIYYDLLLDLASDSRWQINRPSTFANTDTTYYNADGTHQTDTGYAAMGALLKNLIDANPSLWVSALRARPINIGFGIGV